MAFVASTALPCKANRPQLRICPRATPGPQQQQPSAALRVPGDKLARARAAAAALVAAAAVAVSPILSAPADAALFHIRGERPADLGVKYGRYLGMCPSTPNCVSSSANVYDKHYVPGWTYNIEKGAPGTVTKTMDEAITDLRKVLNEYPRVEVISDEAISSEAGKGHYIYAEFESKLMGYIDDVEFVFRPDDGTVEYRSASRLGESDFDANRKRIRDLRVALQQTDPRWGSLGY